MKRLTEQDLLTIEKMYYEEEKAAGEIAAVFGVHRTSIQNALKKRDEARYLAFKSASGKSNKKENKSAVEWESLSAEWLALYHKGWKLKKIAKKYGYDATHVSNIMKKYQKQKFSVLKEERKAENLRRKVAFNPPKTTRKRRKQKRGRHNRGWHEEAAGAKCQRDEP